MPSRKSRSHRNEEDVLFQRMPSKLSKSSKVAIMKSAGMVRQAGRHLEPTAKGRKAIRRAQRKG